VRRKAKIRTSDEAEVRSGIGRRSRSQKPEIGSGGKANIGTLDEVRSGIGRSRNQSGGNQDAKGTKQK
jgi:hypothetical protein